MREVAFAVSAPEMLAASRPGRARLKTLIFLAQRDTSGIDPRIKQEMYSLPTVAQMHAAGRQMTSPRIRMDRTMYACMHSGVREMQHARRTPAAYASSHVHISHPTGRLRATRHDTCQLSFASYHQQGGVIEL